MKCSTFAIAALAFVSSADAFMGITSPQARTPSSLGMSLETYADELKATADKLTREGYGLLACDESTGTVGTRLESIGLENTEENRAEVRFLLDRID